MGSLAYLTALALGLYPLMNLPLADISELHRAA